MKAYPKLAFLLLFSFLTAILDAQDRELSRRARDAMARATDFHCSISTHGGYLWRYSQDLSLRAGEERATATQVWVQSPGTPAVGMAMLRAYEVTGDARHLEGARAAAETLARGQLESGGWDYLIEFDPQARSRWKYRTEPGTPSTAPSTRPARPPANVSTYDDNNTQGALAFLLAFVHAKKPADPRDGHIRDAMEYGLTKLIEAQYPNGAWPQRWDGMPHDPAAHPVLSAGFPADYPREQPRSGYHTHYTLNDNTQRDVIRVLLDAHKRTGERRYLDSAKRGADFLLRAQLPEPQPVWAQQYDAQMHPAWARAFEPPSVTAGESAQIIALLLDLYLELADERYLKPIPPAIAWYRRSQIAPDTWARMYELQTNRPIYGDHDRRIHYTLEEISEERRRGYRWQGDFGMPRLIERAETILRDGREKTLATPNRPPLSAAERDAKAAELEPRVREILAQLDDKGRWLNASRWSHYPSLNEPWIDTNRFVANMRLLCDYLELCEPQ